MVTKLDKALINPLTPMAMVVDLDQIDPYGRNPRRVEHPHKTTIKAALLEIGGMDKPLVISRVNGEARYFVYGSGNTELQCLRELWEETRDACFFKVRCEFVPYLEDSNVLAAHIRANGLQAGLTLCDKAVGLAMLKADWEQQYVETFSMRSFSKLLKKQGIHESPDALTDLLYVARIEAYSWRSLNAGLIGPLNINRIARLEMAAYAAWKQQRMGEDEDYFFHHVFGEALKISDRSWRWSFTYFEDALKAKFIASGVRRDQIDDLWNLDVQIPVGQEEAA